MSQKYEAVQLHKSRLPSLDINLLVIPFPVYLPWRIKLLWNGQIIFLHYHIWFLKD